MDVDSLYPNVMTWMDGARGNHPLAEIIEPVRNDGNSPSVGTAILDAFERVIAGLEAAKPERLPTERADFRKARTWDDLLIVRAELVAGAKPRSTAVILGWGLERIG